MFESKRLRRTKELACECILLSMEEIKINLQNDATDASVTANSASMKLLADAFCEVYNNG